MKIGMVTSWNERCGISSYSKTLVHELISRGHDVKVAANFPRDQVEPDEPFVERFFHVPFMTHEKTANVEGMVNYLKDCDIIHVQFETSLYHPDYFNQLMFGLIPYNKKIVFTMHSGGIWHEFPISRVDHFITHDHPFANNSSVIPMGVKIYKGNEGTINLNTLTSFGLGRNNDDYVNEAIKGMNIDYKTTYGHREWLPLDKLVSKIRESWIISLLYPDIGSTSVSSSAVMLAMGCDRPILVSNTNWFSHIINFPNIYICDTIKDVKEHIKYLTDINNNNTIWKEIYEMKQKLVETQRTFDDFVSNHINLYRKLLNP